MDDVEAMAPGVRSALVRVANDLHHQFQGVFGQETIETVVVDSYGQLAARAKVTRWLIVGAERFARQRLEALVHAEDCSETTIPAVLFLCVHNAGRSQMALGWFTHLAEGRAIAWSGGSEPDSALNQPAVAAMAEIGIDIARQFPKPWTDEFMQAADVVVTMGCGDACPLVPGKHYEDWELEDPSGKSLEQVRPIRDAIGHRVAELMDRLDIQRR